MVISLHGHVLMQIDMLRLSSVSWVLMNFLNASTVKHCASRLGLVK